MQADEVLNKKSVHVEPVTEGPNAGKWQVVDRTVFEALCHDIEAYGLETAYANFGINLGIRAAPNEKH